MLLHNSPSLIRPLRFLVKIFVWFLWFFSKIVKTNMDASSGLFNYPTNSIWNCFWDQYLILFVCSNQLLSSVMVFNVIIIQQTPSSIIFTLSCCYLYYFLVSFKIRIIWLVINVSSVDDNIMVLDKTIWRIIYLRFMSFTIIILIWINQNKQSVYLYLFVVS